MNIDDKEFLKLFNSKERLNCASCGANEFRLIETGMPDTTIEEAVFMICKKCGHQRLELVK